MRQQKRHTEPVYGFTCRFIRKTSASRWRADSHGDLFTMEHRVARHYSGPCRTVWTLMPARYLAKAHSHLAVVHTCLVCRRNTDAENSGLCHFASLFDCRISPKYPNWLTTCPAALQKCEGPQASFQQGNLSGLFRRASFCAHVRWVDVDVAHLNKCRHCSSTMDMDSHGGLEVTIRLTESKKKTTQQLRETDP